MKFTKEELATVPKLIKLPGLDFKCWSPKGLSKLGSPVGGSQYGKEERTAFRQTTSGS